MSQLVRVLGVDPGINGSCAIVDAIGSGIANLVDVIDLPTIGDSTKREINVPEFVSWLRTYSPAHAFIELVHAMPSIPDAAGNRRGMGAASAFRFGLAIGMIRASVIGCRIPLTLVVPTKWKPVFGLKGSDKEASRQHALRLFPNKADAFKRKLDHGRAEATLIAVYGAKVLA